MTHVDYRLLGRILPDHTPIARYMTQRASAYQSAAIVKGVSKVKCQDGSNGDTLVVIARQGKAVTAMYARSVQVTLNHLRVSEIVRM